MLPAAEIGKKKCAEAPSATCVMPHLSPGRLGGLFIAFINSVLNYLSSLYFFPRRLIVSLNGTFAGAKLSKRCSFSACPGAWQLLRTQPMCPPFGD